jgi:hypothetical protein
MRDEGFKAMLPPLNDHGYLPAGVHPASLDEVLDRFGSTSEIRRVQGQSLSWLLPLCHEAGVVRVIVNGSFVTNALEPNDVDCALLIGSAYDEASPAAVELNVGLPFLSIQILRQPAFDALTLMFFGTDRNGVGKGVVEILL